MLYTMKQLNSRSSFLRRLVAILVICALSASSVLVSMHTDNAECEDASHSHRSSTDHCQVCLFATTLYTPTVPATTVSIELQIIERIQYDHSIPTKPVSTSPSDLRAPPITA